MTIAKISPCCILKVTEKDVSLIRKISVGHKKVIGVSYLKRTRPQWIQCILEIMFKFMLSKIIKLNQRRVNNFKPET